MAHINGCLAEPCCNCGFDGELVFGIGWDYKPITCPVCNSSMSDYSTFKEQLYFWNKCYRELEKPPFTTKQATYKHITEVRKNLKTIRTLLALREKSHDASKLESPEVEIFDEYTPKLKDLTYGSEEYNTCLKEMKVALDHHYANNRHHPEHFENGIKDMNLVDIIEMLCDWLAATKRHNDGDIYKSLEINQKRFGYSDELKSIMLNTLNLLGA